MEESTILTAVLRSLKDQTRPQLKVSISVSILFQELYGINVFRFGPQHGFSLDSDLPKIFYSYMPTHLFKNISLLIVKVIRNYLLVIGHQIEHPSAFMEEGILES